MTRRLLIVFDLDGTLVESVQDLAESASELVVALGGRPLAVDEVGAMVGEGASLLVQRALSAAGVDPQTPGALERFLAIYDNRLLNHTRPYPGMRDALTRVSRRARLAVLTNKPVEPSRRILDGLALAELFDEVIGGDGPWPRKPNPAGLRALAARVGNLPTMLVGDTPFDAETAAAAGFAFGWARYGFGAGRFREHPPATSYVVDRPSDLVEVVDRFARGSRR
ncbi:MAG: HAD family hydrolase [Vicinamibacterales bacterium]